MNNPDKLDWYYNLPESNGSFFLIPPTNSEGSFIVRIKPSVIGYRKCYVVEARKEQWLLGLIFFFKCFTETFENGELGNSGGDNPLPFYISFQSGVQHAIFKDVLVTDFIKVRYIPVITLIDGNKINVFYLI